MSRADPTIARASLPTGGVLWFFGEWQARGKQLTRGGQLNRSDGGGAHLCFFDVWAVESVEGEQRRWLRSSRGGSISALSSPARTSRSGRGQGCVSGPSNNELQTEVSGHYVILYFLIVQELVLRHASILREREKDIPEIPLAHSLSHVLMCYGSPIRVQPLFSVLHTNLEAAKRQKPPISCALHPRFFLRFRCILPPIVRMDSVVINLPPPPSRFNLPNSFLRVHKPKTFGVSPITASQLNHQNPYLQCGNHTSNRKPFLLLVPILKNLEDFASKNNWISPVLQTPGEEFGGELLQSGGFGMALLSITATAGVKISPFVATLAANPTFVSGLLAWLVAQSSKVFLKFCVERKWDFRMMCASGGMPSSHSALCTALTASVALCHGVADSLFPVCLGFSLIVMYDAIGVRRHAGMQAQVLNLIVEDLFKWHPMSQRKLKELLGHTPSQVIAGAVLGVLVACICCQACSIAI
ncbi:PREDICTED: uncharacterized protein LOC109180734 [Ipomoea nil]|uniref:uncharacterized protein LOC109180734 n=1 Tax=Ipomoea nil TaxID=35883 RepID=UPI0009016D0C|nr:PREDICTED: uncharacterized protein LOC109180734 [Ipomoea nil]